MAKAAKRGWLARLLRWREAALGWRPAVNTTDVHAMVWRTHIANPKLLELDFTLTPDLMTERGWENQNGYGANTRPRRHFN